MCGFYSELTIRMKTIAVKTMPVTIASVLVLGLLYRPLRLYPDLEAVAPWCV